MVILIKTVSVILLLSCAVLVALLPIFEKKPVAKKHRDPLCYSSSSAVGNVESIHIGGRTEVVSVTGVDVEYYFAIDEWVIRADIVQPKGRKDYFAPVLTGKIDTQYGAAQLVDYSNLLSFEEDGSTELAWTEYRCANIVFRDNKPVSMKFTHTNFVKGEWIVVASYEANF